MVPRAVSRVRTSFTTSKIASRARRRTYSRRARPPEAISRTTIARRRSSPTPVTGKPCFVRPRQRRRSHQRLQYGGTLALRTGSPTLTSRTAAPHSATQRSPTIPGAAIASDDDNTPRRFPRRPHVQVRQPPQRNSRRHYNGSAWHCSDIISAFDSMNRRVFKSFYDEISQQSATWYFYYDPTNRLTRGCLYARCFGLEHLFGIPAHLARRSARRLLADRLSMGEAHRSATSEPTRPAMPIDMWNWPATGNTTRVWSINPDAWGFDKVVSGSGVFQPILFAGQYQDRETAAYENDGITVHRPGLALNGLRTYDPFVGGYLQVDGAVNQTWSSYGYATGNPVGRTDPAGLAPMWSDGTASEMRASIRLIQVNARPGANGTQVGMTGCSGGPGDLTTTLGGTYYIEFQSSRWR